MVSLFQRLPNGINRLPSLGAVQPKPSVEQERIVQEARDWGYFSGAIKSRFDLWRGRRILDIGMGGGPHAISFIHGGAASYVGVDPHVGTDRVRDFRNPRDPTVPAYHAFTYSTSEIMRVFPNVHLYAGYLENVVAQVKQHQVDMAIMSAVTEHLERPHDVVRGIWEILEPGGHMWICHCNYYSWTGHHRAPRSVATWDRTNAEQAKHIDWQHLDPGHPDFSNPNFNRVRLQDLRAVIEKYFEIIEWKISVEAMDRLTPELRRRWWRYTLAELLGQNIYITAKRRDMPLDWDLSGLELHHPSASYLADDDHSGEDAAPYTLANSVFFTGAGALTSHSDNNYAGEHVLAGLKPGDAITVQKFTSSLRLTVAELVQPAGGRLRARFHEAIPPEVISGNHDQWVITDFGPPLAGVAYRPRAAGGG